MSLAVVIELGHKSVLKPERSSDGMTHDWEVYVRGKDDAPIERFIDRVVFTLHKDFPNPVRTVKKPPFSIRESGYGCFQFPIEIYYKNPDRKRDKFDYDLVLKANCDYGHLKPQTLVFERPTGEWKKRLIEGGAVPLAGPSSKPGREEKRPEKSVPVEMKPPAQASMSSLSPKGKVKPAKDSKDPQKVKFSNSFADIFVEPAVPTEKKKKKDKEESKKPEKSPSSSKSDKEKSEKPRDKSKEKHKSETKHKDDEKKKGHDKDESGKHQKRESKGEHSETKKEDTRSVADKLKEIVKSDGVKSKPKEIDKAREKSDKKEKEKSEKDKVKEKNKEKSDDRSRKPEKEKRSENKTKESTSVKESSKEGKLEKKDETKPKSETKKEIGSEEKDKKAVKKESGSKKPEKSDEKSASSKHSKESKSERSKDRSSIEKPKSEQAVKSEKSRTEKPREKVETPKEKVKIEEVKNVSRDPIAKKTMPVAKEQPKPEKEPEPAAKTESETSPVKKLEESVKDNRAKNRKDSSTSVSSTSVSSPSHVSSSSDSSPAASPEPTRLPAKPALPLQKLISNISSDSLSSSDSDFGSPNLKSKEKKEEPKRKQEEKPSQLKYEDEEKPPRGKGPPRVSSQPVQRSCSPSPETESVAKKQDSVPVAKEAVKKQASQNKFPASFIKRAMQNKERENEILQKEKETAKMVGNVSRTTVPSDRQKPKLEVESTSNSSSSDSENEKSRPLSRQNPPDQMKKPVRASPIVPEGRTSSSPLMKKRLNSSDEAITPKAKVPARTSPVKKVKEESSSSSSEDEETVRKPTTGRASSQGIPPEPAKILNSVKKRRSSSTTSSEEDTKVEVAVKGNTVSPSVFRQSNDQQKSLVSRMNDGRSLEAKKNTVKPDTKITKVDESSLSESSSEDETPRQPIRKPSPLKKGPSPARAGGTKQRPTNNDEMVKKEDLQISESSSEDDLPMPALKQQPKKVEESERQRSLQVRPNDSIKVKPSTPKQEEESSLSDSSSDDEKIPAIVPNASFEQKKKIEKVVTPESRSLNLQPNETVVRPKAEHVPLQKRPSPPEESSDEEGEIIEVNKERDRSTANLVKAEPTRPTLSEASSDEAEKPVNPRVNQRSPRLRKSGSKSATRRSSSSISSSDNDKTPPRQKLNSVSKITGQKRDRESSSERSDHRTKKQPTASPSLALAQKRTPIPNSVPPSQSYTKALDSDSDDELKPAGIQWVTVGPGEVPDIRFTDDYLSDLLELQKRIAALSDPDLAQKVVDIIEQTGCFEISETTFDFDACKLDVMTVRKLRNVLKF